MSSKDKGAEIPSSGEFTTVDTNIESSSTRKVHFDEKVRFGKAANSEVETDVMWFSELEIMEHTKREKKLARKSQNSPSLDMEGMFTKEERKARTSRLLAAHEAVFDMQMVNKKDKELQDSGSLFAGEALENDHEAALAEEYMLFSGPAMGSAVCRANHLELHVQLLWQPSD